MDVRCDRCQTEYELDDAIVTEAGAAVQCTTCGHTFFVRPGGATATGPALPRAEEFSVPETPEWTLRTEDEKVHRFRDFNTLQRWVVERKVTRGDRVSRSSGPWRALGELPELAPFFAVVEEADRARLSTSVSAPAAARDNPPRREPAPVAPVSMPGVTAPSLAGVSAAGVGAASRSSRLPEDGPTEPNRRLPPVPAAALGVRTTGKLDTTVRAREKAGRGAAEAPPPDDFSDMDYPPATHRGRNLIVLVLVLGATGAGGYWLWNRQYPAVSPTTPHPEVATPAPEPAAAVPPAVAVAPSPALAPAPGPPPAPAPAPAEPAPTAPSSDAVVPVIPDARALPIARAEEGSAPRNATTVPEDKDKVDGRGQPRPERTSGGRAEAPKPAATQSAAGTYEKWVAEGDRALARRGVAKADQFYAQALALRPNGVAALTGSAYVLLDRQRHFKAIETFRRAIAIEPNYGPALFGIAESYRARGDAPQALLAYRQYLAMSPSGTEAPAARRQIKDLSSDDDAP